MIVQSTSKSNYIISNTNDNQLFSGVNSDNGSVTHYFRNKCLSSRPGADVFLCNSQIMGMGKCKVIKWLHTPERAFLEYETTLIWPKGTTGLLLRPKGCLNTPFGAFFIMHKYDGELGKSLHLLSANEKIEAICQICQGLVTLHDLRMAHGDIHIGNILYDKKKNRFDLIDFEHVTEDTDDFKEDFEDLKICIEGIIMGEPKYESPRELYELDDVIKLGFNLESAKLILDFMDSDPKDAKEILQCFNKIKELNG